MFLTAYRMIDPRPRGGFLARHAASLCFAVYRLLASLTAWQHRKTVYAADMFATEMTNAIT